MRHFAFLVELNTTLKGCRGLLLPIVLRARTFCMGSLNTSSRLKQWWPWPSSLLILLPRIPDASWVFPFLLLQSIGLLPSKLTVNLHWYHHPKYRPRQGIVAGILGLVFKTIHFAALRSWCQVLSNRIVVVIGVVLSNVAIVIATVISNAISLECNCDCARTCYCHFQYHNFTCNCNCYCLTLLLSC